jgi:import inner membrane translocase subunit TIM50
LTYLEQKRKEAQRQYKEEQAYIELHKGDFERLMEEDRQAMAKEMSGTLWGALDSLAGGGPKKEKETKPTAQPDASGASGQTATKQ